jgi:hypothetical protein
VLQHAGKSAAESVSARIETLGKSSAISAMTAENFFAICRSFMQPRWPTILRFYSSMQQRVQNELSNVEFVNHHSNRATGTLRRWVSGRSGPRATQCYNSLMDAKELAEEKAKLKPGQWLDYLPEPLETVADVEDLMRRVAVLEAKRKEAAILRASKN